MSIILQNASYIDWQTLRITHGCNILIEPGEGGKIFLNPEFSSFKETEVIDCTGKWVTKSLVNAHHHIYSALARGMDPPPVSPDNFHQTLQYIWWRLDKSLNADMIRASALFAAMDSLKNGVTFVIDHHASPNLVPGSLDIIKEAFDSLGISHLLCYEISDRDGMTIAHQGLDETERYLSQNQGLIGLHASFTLSEESMAMAFALAAKTGKGIHIHVAEDHVDQTHCQANFGERVIQRLDHWGLLDYPSSILAHCIHLSLPERKILASKPAWIVQNPESNLNNQVGFFTNNLLNKPVMLGTDGMHSDMFQSARYAYFSGKNYEKLSPSDVFTRLRNVHHYLSKNNFAGDGENNLVVMDYQPPTPVTTENLPGHLFYGMGSKEVIHVISNGRLVVRNRQITTADEMEILDYCRSQAIKLWTAMKTI